MIIIVITKLPPNLINFYLIFDFCKENSDAVAVQNTWIIVRAKIAWIFIS